MPDLWMDVDAALAEVSVNIFPLLDDTDFKSRETGVAYDAAGMDLVWNFTTTAGATTQTAVTPTIGGDYDWAHQGNGMYTIEIPASGGASINNDTEGFGWFTGVATGVLPWRGPVIGFRAAGLNNLLIDSAYSATRGLAGTALPDAASDAAGGLPISDAGGLDLDTQIGTNIDAIVADTNELQTDDVPSLIAALNDLSAADVATELATYDAPTKAELDAGLAALNDPTAADIRAEMDANSTQLAAIVADTNELQTDDVPGTLAAMDTKLDTIDGVVDNVLVDTAEIGAAGAGLTAIPWNAAWDAEVQSEAEDALNAYDPPTKAELDAAVANVSVDEIQMSALADLFNTDSGTDYASAVAGSVVKETADNAGGASLTEGGIADAVWDEALAGHAVVGSAGEALADAGSGASASDIADAVWDETSAGHTDAGKAGTQIWTGIDAVPGLIAALNDLDAAAINAEVDTALADYDPPTKAELDSGLAGLNNLSAAEVNAQVVDALNVDTYAEPGQGAPPATATLAAKINYLFKFLRNKLTQTATGLAVYNSAGDTVDHKATVSDDGTVFTRGEIESGP